MHHTRQAILRVLQQQKSYSKAAINVFNYICEQTDAHPKKRVTLSEAHLTVLAGQIPPNLTTIVKVLLLELEVIRPQMVFYDLGSETEITVFSVTEWAKQFNADGCFIHPVTGLPVPDQQMENKEWLQYTVGSAIKPTDGTTRYLTYAQTKTRNLLIDFLDDIRSYTHECDSKLHEDDRESYVFVDMFLNKQ